MRVLAAALLSVAIAACDAPWDGPSLPSGAHWIAYRTIASGAPNCAPTERLIAGTTTGQVQDEVRSACRGRGCNADVGCWPGLTVGPGDVLVAVYTGFDLCGANVRSGTAYAPNTLYFIHWVGRSSGQCPETIPAPIFVLYSVALADVPNAGVLTIELQEQSPDHAPFITRTQLPLA